MTYNTALRRSSLLLTLFFAVQCGSSGDDTTGGAAGSGGKAGAGRGGSGGAQGTGGARTGGGSGAGAGGATSSGGSGGSPSTNPPMGSGGSGAGGGQGGGAGGSTSPDAGGGEAGPPAVGDDLPPCKRMVEVAGSGALSGAVTGAMPGDCLILADGMYSPVVIGSKGTAAAPIVIRAANRLKASFSGVVKLTNASYVVLEGFTYPGAAGTSIDGNSNNNRVTRSRFFTGTAQVTGMAIDNRIDHCEFGPKANDGNLVQPTGLSKNTRIDHNYFHDVTGGGGNGRETIRLGCCGAMFDNYEAGNLVEHNLLENCSGEAEIVSIKSSKNTVRYNTIRRSNGNLTLRAGKNNSIYGNFIFGTGNQGGIRMFDDGHKIWNNYVETGQALIANRSGPIHAAVRNAIIVHNTFLGSVNVAGTGNVFSDNITGGSVTLNGAMATNNLTSAAAGLARMGDVQAITAMSAAVNAGKGSYPFLMDDVNGQPRTMPDVGADELATSPERFRPLTTKDVGPDAP